MLLEIRNASVSRGGHTVLSGFSFYIKGTEKIAVVGRNGAGKTTLLKVIDGSCPPDRIDGHPEAQVRFSRAVTIGMASQTVRPEDEDRTPDELARTAAGMRQISGDSPLFADFISRFRSGFTRLGFAPGDRDRKLSEFSGGEQTKILLLRLLMTQPDILLLDEPTNHLDIQTVEWLEEEVRKYPKAVVAVSHDRYFIDRTADTVWEISSGKLTRYAGNYTQYREEKTQQYDRLMRRYQAQQEQRERLEKQIGRFRVRPRKAAFARSKEKYLGRMEQIEKPQPDEARIHTEEILPARMGSRNVMDCDRLAIGYVPSKPLREVSLRVKRGQKIGIFGPNGSGKSTFLKTIAGRIPKLSGRLSVSESADIAYFDQMTAELVSDDRVFDYFHDRFPSLTGQQVRAVLAGYLFGQEDLGKKVSVLSGGEKARLVLAVLLQRRPNVLLLDEPTNNMDIPAKETLESVFRQYRGTLIFISHDRYFLSHVARELLYFPPDSDRVLYYPFGYEHFRGKQGAGAADARDTEQQRMIEDLRAVPRGVSMRPREIPTADLQLDWELAQNRERRKPAEEAFRLASGQYEAALLHLDERTYADPEDYLTSDEDVLRLEERRRRLEEARDEWTRELIGWYEILQGE